MAADLRPAAKVICLNEARASVTLKQLAASALEQKPHLDIELCETEDGTPYLSVDLPGWANIMVTPDKRQHGTFGVVISDNEGYHIKIAKAVSAARALFKIIHYS